MKDFSIPCVDKDKQPIGTQNVSMSENEIDKHKFSFLDKEGNPLFVIDAEAGELILDNSDGSFDAISTDKPTAKIKISNIKLDADKNLVFTMDGTAATYRISGNTFEMKKGREFEPVKTYPNVLDIVFPSTFFEDIKNNKLTITNLPFQMFEAIANDEPEKHGIEVFQSKNKLLHMIKVEGQLYIGRGHRLIPIEPNSQNYYKMGDQSVAGFTVGRNNGISGKQSQGIAFKMSEAELEEVAKFVNGGLDSVEFKDKDQFDAQDIDYVRVNKQSDFTRVVSGLTPEGPGGDGEGPGGGVVPGGGGSGGSGGGEGPGETGGGSGGGESPDGGGTNNDGGKKDSDQDKNKKDSNTKKEEPKAPKDAGHKEKAEVNFAIAGMAAFILAVLLITGIAVGLWAYVAFGILGLTAVACTTVGTIEYTKYKKTPRAIKEKTDKMREKISKKQKDIDKTTKQLAVLQEKEQTPKTAKKIAKLTKKLEKQNVNLNKQIQKLDNLQNPNSNQAQETTEEQASRQLTEHQDPILEQPVTPVVEDNAINQEMINENNPSTALSTESVDSHCSTINNALAAMERGKPQSVEERASMVTDINDKVVAACPDGLSVDNVNVEDKELYQSYINFRTAYIAEQSAKATYEKALAEGAENVVALEADYKAARTETNNQLNNMYAATKAHELAKQTKSVQEQEDDQEAVR